jgi:hypothetical protein
MENLFGWIFFLIIFSSILIYSNYNKNIKFFLLTAFLLRFLCVILDQYNLVNLPDSTIDAGYFELKALEFSRIQGLSVIFDFYIKDSLLISRIISLFYTVFGESKMIGQSISVALGTASVYLVYKICLILWDNHSAKKAAWVTALFPTLILYSSLILREVYIVFILLYSLLAITNFIRNKTYISFFKILVSFYALTFFHGASSIGLFVLLSYLMLQSMKKLLIKIYDLKINIFSFLFIIILLIPIISFLTQNLSIPYIPNEFDLEKIIYQINASIRGGSKYPSFLYIEHKSEFFFQIILRIFYFLYSPFVWDIEKTYHIIGFFDGLLYFILTIYIIINWHAIWRNPILQIFILMFVFYMIVHAIGVGNFGTGIRHRSKFVVLLIILAAPKINTFILSRKKIYKN